MLRWIFRKIFGETEKRLYRRDARTNVMETFKVVLYDAGDGEGWLTAECPQLPGCISQGKTREDAIANIREAIELYLETLESRHERRPGVEIVDVTVTA